MRPYPRAARSPPPSQTSSTPRRCPATCAASWAHWAPPRLRKARQPPAPVPVRLRWGACAPIGIRGPDARPPLARARAALEAGGGGRAAEAERRLALSKVSTAPAAKAAQQSQARVRSPQRMRSPPAASRQRQRSRHSAVPRLPQTALGMSEPLATFRPGASTWNSDAPEPQRGNQPATALSAADAALVDPYAELRFSSAPTTTAARCVALVTRCDARLAAYCDAPLTRPPGAARARWAATRRCAPAAR